MFGIPERELKQTLAHADVALLAWANVGATAKQTLVDVQGLVAQASALLTEIKKNGVTITLKAGNGA